MGCLIMTTASEQYLVSARNMCVDLPLRGLSRAHSVSGEERVERRGGRYVLKSIIDVNLNIKRGDRIGLLGQNGAGKTSLLRALSGIYPISSGTLEINGSVYSILSSGDGINEILSGRENALLRYRMLSNDDELFDEYISDIESFIDIGEFFDLPVKIYSAGMRSRLQFAIATAFSADILLLDEWLGVADVNFQARASIRLQKALAHNGALVFATHDKNLLESVVQNILVMEDGRIVDEVHVTA